MPGILTGGILVLAMAGAGPSALYEAARDGDQPAVVRLLAAGAEPDGAPGRVTPLAVAANQGYLEIVERLLASGADPHGGEGFLTPLVAAAHHGHLPVVERLLEAGAGTAEALSEGLLAAAREGHPRTAAALVRAGAPLAATDWQGLSPLHLAAKWGRPQTVRTLVALGAAVDAPDPRGRTALMWASWWAHSDVVRLLASLGADPSRADAAGDSALLGEPSLETALARMLDHRRRASAPPDPGGCSAILVSATARVRSPDGMTAWGLPRRPRIGEEGWAVPREGGRFTRVRVRSVQRDACTGEAYEPELVPVEGSLHEEMRDFNLVLPARPSPPRLAMPPIREQLPWGTFSDTVEQVVDLDRDGRPDLVRRSFCCGDDSQPTGLEPASGGGCEYSCWDSWALGPDGWVRCAEGGPC